MSKPVILLFGATGAQGGSVIKYLLKSGDKFKLRAVSRNINSDNAKALAKVGVELVAGDFVTGIPVSTFSGVTAVFLVTNFWDQSSCGKEYEQSVPIVDAAYDAGVSQFVFSSLANGEKESGGKYKVPFHSEKAKVEEYIRKKGFKYTAFPAAAFYYQNFTNYFAARADSDGNYSITMPQCTRPIPAQDISQYGGIVTAILSDPEKYNGRFICTAGDCRTAQEYVDILSETVGKKITLNLIPTEVFAKFPLPGAEDIADMFGWFDEYGHYGLTHQWDEGKQIDPTLRTFKEYLAHCNYEL